MVQNILTIFIISLAGGYTIYQFIRQISFLKKKDISKCPGCGSCDAKKHAYLVQKK